MAWIEDTLRCDGCGVEITLSPVVVDQYEYCCLDCSQGLKCDCALLVELEETRRATSDDLETQNISLE